MEVLLALCAFLSGDDDPSDAYDINPTFVGQINRLGISFSDQRVPVVVRSEASRMGR